MELNYDEIFNLIEGMEPDKFPCTEEQNQLVSPINTQAHSDEQVPKEILSDIEPESKRKIISPDNKEKFSIERVTTYKNETAVEQRQKKYTINDTFEAISTPLCLGGIMPRLNIADNDSYSPITNTEQQDSFSESKLNSQCKHVTIIEEQGILLCQDCGETVDDSIEERSEKPVRYVEDATRCRQVRKPSKNSIHKDVKKYGVFPGNIVDIADGIYEKVITSSNSSTPKLFRGNARKSIILAAIHFAYMIKEKRQYPTDELSKIFGISQNVALKGINSVCLAVEEVRMLNITIEDLIRELLHKLHAFRADGEAACAIYTKIKHRNKKLNKSRIHSVASGIVWYYISNTRSHITLEYFAEQADLSIATITRISSIVSMEVQSADSETVL
ncbi:MAG: hypothetical protein JKX76_02385 [Colwellia sp.]|nr:hypothetical protein [Colwellia sp.]